MQQWEAWGPVYTYRVHLLGLCKTHFEIFRQREWKESLTYVSSCGSSLLQANVWILMHHLVGDAVEIRIYSPIAMRTRRLRTIWNGFLETKHICVALSLVRSKGNYPLAYSSSAPTPFFRFTPHELLCTRRLYLDRTLSTNRAFPALKVKPAITGVKNEDKSTAYLSYLQLNAMRNRDPTIYIFASPVCWGSCRLFEDTVLL